MTASSPLPAPTLVPVMRYRDLAAAIGWLSAAFGFEKQVAVSDGEGGIIYAQMTYGASLVMLGSVRDTELDKLLRQPDEVGGIETQSCYVVVEDADAHHARALEAGAEIVVELKSDGYGRRGYSCRDLEGHIWTFGTYNPAKGFAPAEVQPVAPSPQPRPWRHRAFMAAALLISGSLGWWAHDLGLARSMSAQVDEAELAYAELSKVRGEKRAAEQLAQNLKRDLGVEKAARATAEAAAAANEKTLAAERSERSALEKEALDLRQRLEAAERAKSAALESNKKVAQDLFAARTANRALEEKSHALEVEAARRDSGDEIERAVVAAQSKPQIETSATAAPEVPPQQADSDGSSAPPVAAQPPKTSILSKPSLAQSRPKRSPARQSARPTYVMDLADVPWPYNHWYRKR